MSEWKPGDVAMVSMYDSEHLALVRPRKAANDALEFAYTTGGYDMVDDLADGCSARPLVVIDPENRREIERLRDEYDREVIWQNDDPDPRDVTPSARANALGAALREFAHPTRIEEPQGLGAVVELADGERWLHAYCDEGRKQWIDKTGHIADFEELPVVRVLSHGVTGGAS